MLLAIRLKIPFLELFRRGVGLDASMQHHGVPQGLLEATEVKVGRLVDSLGVLVLEMA